MVGSAIVGAILITLGLSRLQPAAPSVDASTLWRDTVRLGTFVRDVRGPGTLVPENIRWVSAVTAGRIEEIHVQPGDRLKAGSPLMDLTNPDAQLELLGAEQQLTAAQAQLVELGATLQGQKLDQEGTVAQLQSQYQDAVRQANTDQNLAAKDLIATNDLKAAQEKVQELKTRLDAETQRLKVITNQMQSQVKVQQEQVNRLQAIVVFRKKELAALHVVAPGPGVLQDQPLQVGQWVTAGTVLAKIVEPGRLKAVLQIPETQASNVQIGQPASIDTRNGLITGTVSRIYPAAQNGTVAVDVRLEGAMPAGARPDLSVDGTITVDRLQNTLYVGRPAYGQPNSRANLFKVVGGGGYAVRVPVELGQASVNTVQILGGLKKGDVVILSDMSQYDDVDRVRLK